MNNLVLLNTMKKQKKKYINAKKEKKMFWIQKVMMLLKQNISNDTIFQANNII